MRRLSPLIAFASAFAGAAAHAGGKLGPSQAPIATSQYTIDFFTGPVVSSSRVVGLGGAFSAIAEGVDADPVNPAAPCVRLPWSGDWLSFDLSLGLSLPGLLSKIDFENAIHAQRHATDEFEYRGNFVPNVGMNIAMGRWALGAFWQERRFSLALKQEGSDTTHSFAARFDLAHLLLARAFWRGQLSVGIGLRIATLLLDDDDPSHANLFTLSTASGEIGFLLAPSERRFRIGLVARLPVEERPSSTGVTPDSNGDLIFKNRFYLPQSIVLPWEIELGVAFELGTRPLNPEWTNPDEYSRALRGEIDRARTERANRLGFDEERALRKDESTRLDDHEDDLRARRMLASRQLPRRRFLVTASVLLTGPVSDGVSTSSFLRQKVERSGERPAFTPRLGVETEPVPGWLQVRLGTYLEPGRITSADARLHGTGGFDFKVLPWTVFGLYEDGTWWSIGAFFDLAERYNNAFVRIGLWR